MSESISHVGMDVHANEIVVAMYRPGEERPLEWRVGCEERSIKRLARRVLKESGGRVECVYEAGPTGFHLQRRMESLGVLCHVAAPSLIPVKPGHRVRTDRRDARKLGRYLRSGDLTFVRPPSEEEEAVRELCRRRTTVRRDLTRARQRLGQMLLRRGRVYRQGTRWTQKHRRWLQQQEFEHVWESEVFEDSLFELGLLESRLESLTQKVQVLAESPAYRERVGWVRCFRGFDTISAMILLSELHGIERFSDPRHLMGFLGLVPSEDSSGSSRRQGSITKAGNVHARWILVEASWHHRHRARVSEELRRRRAGQPVEVIAIADKAMKRLHDRYFYLVMGRKLVPQKVVVALAREMVGFLWSLLVQYPQQLEEQQR